VVSQVQDYQGLRRLRWLAVPVSAIAVAVACTTFDDVELKTKVECIGAVFPPPPAETGESKTELPPLIFALYRVDSAAAKGINQDRACTCTSGTGDSCLSIAPEAGVTCDSDDAGRDNAFPAFIKRIRTGLDGFQDGLVKAGVVDGGLDASLGSLVDFKEKGRKTLDAGKSGILVFVSRYNGTANDSSVDVDVRRSPGSVGSVPLSQDVANKFRVFARAPDDPSPGRGYVRDGMLYAALEMTKFAFEDNSVVTLNGAAIVAKLVSGSGGYSLNDGELSGRWRQNNFLYTLDQLEIDVGLYVPGGGKQRICALRNDPRSQLFVKPLLAQLEGDVCGFADIASQSADDGKPFPCNAISTTFTFQGAPVDPNVEEVRASKRPNDCEESVRCKR
jgi:hypothetical protein